MHSIWASLTVYFGSAVGTVSAITCRAAVQGAISAWSPVAEHDLDTGRTGLLRRAVTWCCSFGGRKREVPADTFPAARISDRSLTAVMAVFDGVTGIGQCVASIPATIKRRASCHITKRSEGI